MSIDIQINPRAEAISISPALAHILDEHAEDFDIRYCALEPTPEVIAAIRAIQPRDTSERRAITLLLRELEAGEPVELHYSA